MQVAWRAPCDVCGGRGTCVWRAPYTQGQGRGGKADFRHWRRGGEDKKGGNGEKTGRKFVTIVQKGYICTSKT